MRPSFHFARYQRSEETASGLRLIPVEVISALVSVSPRVQQVATSLAPVAIDVRASMQWRIRQRLTVLVERYTGVLSSVRVDGPMATLFCTTTSAKAGALWWDAGE
ncbi:hypothetical protein AS200_00075 [Streptomyces sp. CdTB01]|nr:hypothetical protein AS200_00075 [Streptomyces sp. CdTB01]